MREPALKEYELEPRPMASVPGRLAQHVPQVRVAGAGETHLGFTSATAR